jgi:pimeloyl-ACP methyl ester carboxylesterase
MSTTGYLGVVQPRLIETSVPRDPEGVVLVLHGGASRKGTMGVSPAQLSVLRMVPIARRAARAGHGRLAVFRLLNSHRGWDTTHTPLHDAHWALDQIAERLGGHLPTCLVGHSLGGRAALLAAGSPAVTSAVALAPWVLPTDLPTAVRGRRLLIVHGARDRIASPRRSLELATRLRGEAEVSYVCVEDGAHAMLRHHAVFDGLAARFAAATLLDGVSEGSLGQLPAGARLISL